MNPFVRRSLGLLVLAGLPASAAAQPWISLPVPEIGAHRFVSDTDDATAIFLNPGGLATGHGTNLYLDLSGDDGDMVENVAALQGGSWGFGYRHRELAPRGMDATYLNGAGLPASAGHLDTYSLASSFGPPAFQVGTARVWNNTDLPGHDASSWKVGVLSRPTRALSLGGMVENVNRPRFLDARLRPRYTYGISVRPLPGDPELLTVSVQGTHGDGDPDLIDLAFGARMHLESGLELGLSVQDPRNGSVRVGASVSTYFGKGAASARVRSVGGDTDYRALASLQVFDEFWQRSMPTGKRVATLDLEGTFEDEGSGFVLLRGESRGVQPLVRRIDHAARDKDIRALALRVGDLTGGFVGPVGAPHEELRQALLRFRSSGKPVVAYLDALAGGTEMYLASAADRVVLPPLSGVMGIGVSLHLNRYKRAFEKLGVSWDADTAGVYKSSFHSWYTDSTSAAQRVAIQDLVDGAYDHLMTTLQTSRGLSDADAARIGSGGIVFPETCVATHLVDTLGWWDDALAAADSLSGGPGKRPPTVTLPHRRYWSDRWRPAPAVAVVSVSGEIASGRSKRNWILGGRTMGSQTVIRQLRAAAGYPGVRALVFRVDSGGGSALASEEIRHEILKILRRHRRLPFLVSMGGMAASGGYWISMDGQEILADATTITGSIGVVWSFPVLEDLYGKLGVTSETFKRGEHADMLSWNRHLTEDEREMMNASVDYIYDRFVAGVAEGRKLPESRVREIAGGRVYLGSQAEGLGLVDRLGTLTDAVEQAAERAGIGDDYRVLDFRARNRGVLGRFLRTLGLPAGPAGDAAEEVVRVSAD